MSRPKIEEQDKRIVQVNIRLTAIESSSLNELADASGLSPANWIRYKIFTGKNPPVKLSPLDASIYQELKKIGVNLNQVTHRINQGDLPKEFLTCQQELLVMLNRILNTLIHDGQPDQG